MQEFDPWWHYFIQPWLAGIIGWITNVIALQLMFYPIEYRGIHCFRIKDQPLGLFGWQGVIPTKAEKMASLCVDLMTTKLFNVKEIFSRLKAERFSEVMESGLLLLLDQIIDEVASDKFPRLWLKLPQEVRDEIVIIADRESPKFLTAFMRDMQENIDDVLDIKHMCVTACVQNKPYLNKIFQECGEKEFHFIRISGFYFGFLFGCVQMTVWIFYPAVWVLPVAGFFVGIATNWFALKIIFRPLEPHTIGPFKVQGIFLKRQKEVSETFARINCINILHAKAMWNAIFTGPKSKFFFAMIRAHSIMFTDHLFGALKPVVLAALGASKFAEIKEDIATKLMEKLPSIIDQSYEYTTEALQMEDTMREKMQELTSAEFEGVLHPAFQEDEITLILVGGILGGVIGTIEFVIFQIS